MDNNNTIVIAAGGTGGHLYPGIALARELRDRGMEPVFVVRQNDAGEEILARENLRFVEIPVIGMPRSVGPRLLRFAWYQLKGFARTWKLLKELRPQAVAGMGGYISFPVIVTGRFLGIPTLIHEQNVIPGLANRVLSRIARRVAVSFPEAAKHFPRGKTVVTGNPVRRELFNAVFDDACRNLGLAPDRFTILVFGGSQGASRINSVTVNSYALLADLKDRLQYLHITGKKDFDAIEEAYRRNGIPGTVLPYLHTIGDAYCVADMIVCRSGATTIAELELLGKPALLIPFPYATANHQEFNAATLVARGRAVMIREAALDAGSLAGIIRERASSWKGKTVQNTVLQVRFPQETLADELIKLYNKGA